MIKRISILIIAILLCTLPLSLPCFASSSETLFVHDNADLFTYLEIEQLEAASRAAFDKTGCSIFIVTVNNNYIGDQFIEDHLDGIEGDTTILIITDKYFRVNYDMYTYGKCDRRISDAEVNEILDHELVYDNIKYNGNYGTAALQFVNMSAAACESKIGLAIIIGIIFGTLTTASLAGGVVYSYKKKLRSEVYPLDRYASLEITGHSDIFMGKFVTRRTINTGNGGRGGGRIGGGRSGGRGGGGGHRGGR